VGQAVFGPLYGGIAFRLCGWHLSISSGPLCPIFRRIQSILTSIFGSPDHVPRYIATQHLVFHTREAKALKATTLPSFPSLFFSLVSSNSAIYEVSYEAFRTCRHNNLFIFSLFINKLYLNFVFKYLKYYLSSLVCSLEFSGRLIREGASA